MQSSSFTFKKLFWKNLGQTLCHELREPSCLKTWEKEIYFQQNSKTDFLLGHVSQNSDFINTCNKGYKTPLSKYIPCVAPFFKALSRHWSK